MIRPAVPDDFGRLIALWLESAEKSHPFVPKAYWVDLVEEMRSVRLPYSETTVFVQGNHVVGFISTLDKHVLALYVESKAQSQGVGRELLNQAKLRSSSLLLDVFSENERGFSFYQREGFVPVERHVDASGHELTSMEWKQ